MNFQEKLKRGARTVLDRSFKISTFSKAIDFFNEKYKEFILSSRHVQEVKQQYESRLTESQEKIFGLKKNVFGFQEHVACLTETISSCKTERANLTARLRATEQERNEALEAARELKIEAEQRREALKTSRELFISITEAYREVTAEILTGKDRGVSPEIIEKYQLKEKIAEIATAYKKVFQNQQEELKWWRRNGFETALDIFIEKNPDFESLPFAYYTGGTLRRESLKFSETIKRQEGYNTLEELSQIFRLPKHAARKIYGAETIEEGEHYIYSGKRPLSEKGHLVRIEFEAFGLPDEKGVIIYVTPVSRFKPISKKYKQMRELMKSYINSVREFIEQSRQKVKLTPELAI